MSNNEHKMIFLDLDGTLLNDEKGLPPENKTAIEKALNMGHKVFICTGRPLSSAIKQLPRLGLNREGCYAIAFNGGIIYDPGKQRNVYEKMMVSEDAVYVVKKAYEAGLHIQAYDDVHVISQEDNAQVEKYAATIKMEIRIVDDMAAMLSKEKTAKLLAMAPGYEKARLEAFKMDLEEWTKNRMEVFYSCDEYLEFGPLGISKGNAIRFMSDYLNIPMENTIACGDAENDITMLDTAAIGAVMKNASEEMKHHGNYVTKSDNNHGGVAEVIEKFML